MRHLARFILCAALVLSLASVSAAATPERKPDATIKTRTIEASISIDPVLHAYPGLYDRLLAAGKYEMAKWKDYADKDYRKNAKLFREMQGFSFDRTYEQRSAIQGYISIVRTDYSYSTGAAHPNHSVDTLLWDVKARKFINIHPFFTDTRADSPAMRALAAAIKDAVVAEKMKRGLSREEASDPMWVGNIKPDITKIGAIALAPSTEPDKSAGLIVYFPPYAVGAYVEGTYVVFVPWTAFKAHMSATGERLFGGARPPGDAKHDEL